MSQTSPVGELTIVKCRPCEGRGVITRFWEVGYSEFFCDICGGWGYYWRKPPMTGTPPKAERPADGRTLFQKLGDLFSLPKWARC